MEPRNRCQGINSASLCSLAGRYENPIPPRCLAPIDFLKILAQAAQHGGIGSLESTRWNDGTYTLLYGTRRNKTQTSSTVYRFIFVSFFFLIPIFRPQKMKSPYETTFKYKYCSRFNMYKNLVTQAALRIRNVYHGSRIPDQTFFNTGSNFSIPDQNFSTPDQKFFHPSESASKN
jgi:hypothetical protein